MRRILLSCSADKDFINKYRCFGANEEADSGSCCHI